MQGGQRVQDSEVERVQGCRGCRAEVQGCRAHEFRWVRECSEHGLQRAQGCKAQLQGVHGS